MICCSAGEACDCFADSNKKTDKVTDMAMRIGWEIGRAARKASITRLR